MIEKIDDVLLIDITEVFDGVVVTQNRCVLTLDEEAAEGIALEILKFLKKTS